MANSEAGWTKKFPSAHGCYWVKYLRVGLRHVPPFLIEVDAHGIWNFGVEVSRDYYSFHDCEFLGPVTVSDAEQLIELSKAAESMLTLLENIGTGMWARSPEGEMLRAALNPKQPEKETQ